MRIIYNKNPCLSSIILDDVEKELFVEKFKVEYFLTNLHHLNYLLDKKDDKIQALKDLNNVMESYYNTNVDEEAKTYFTDLEKGVHVGDCTCVPCTCTKCYAEDILGVSTIEGLGKHHLYKIDNYFSKNPDNTIDDAITYLTKYYDSGPVPDNWKNSEEAYWKYMVRWKEEAKQAAEWLDTTHRKNLEENNRYKIVDIANSPEFLFVDKGLEVTNGYVQYITINGNKFSSNPEESMALYKKV